VKKILLESISTHEDKNVTESCQCRFAKGNSCLTNVIAFHSSVTDLVDEGRAVEIVYFDFSKVFDAISRHIIIVDS